jgi:hypothetical protein
MVRTSVAGFVMEASTMATVQSIEQAVSQLSLEELARFRDWFDEFDAELWDRQIEADAESGKLDGLAEQALADLNADKCREL